LPGLSAAKKGGRIGCFAGAKWIHRVPCILPTEANFANFPRFGSPGRIEKNLALPGNPRLFLWPDHSMILNHHHHHEA
jgi:hypothetical protein